jgi:hypothetical protein
MLSAISYCSPISAEKNLLVEVPLANSMSIWMSGIKRSGGSEAGSAGGSVLGDLA